ncbi:MAG: DUF1326 domain-containing protein [Firmicutes bacterium]|nr:DUF1326 domain-containing protein [Bacillota bacterium]
MIPATPQPPAGTDFHLTASYIEACSCDQFCPCYFNQHAKQHGNKHFCEFNMGIKVDNGQYKDVNLAGVKVWLTGDLGDEWAKGKANWLVVHFDPAVTEAQRAAMTDILLQLYPMEWNILGVETKPIYLNVDQAAGVATARLGNGEGEIILERYAGDNPSKDIAINNLKYWAAQSNDGFLMWKNRRHYYVGHDKKLDYSGTNGFLITIHFHGNAKASAAD